MRVGGVGAHGEGRQALQGAAVGGKLELGPGEGLDAGLVVGLVEGVEFGGGVLHDGGLDGVDDGAVVGQGGVLGGEAEHGERDVGVEGAVDVEVLAGGLGAVEVG